MSEAVNFKSNKNQQEGIYMQSYEFYAVPQNGVIKIPEQFRKKITYGVKVILQEQPVSKSNENEDNTRRKSDLLSPPTLKTKGWKFNREEANER